ncbi:DNA-binding protein [Sulfuracidifex metallicus]|jgi:DNA-binding protein Alba|uniref:DNA-binding protein n=1 Tax=Sulfuracidifex metallicus TaxID=47303 RepID=UPI002272D41C|nr:DNA-binding protein [Sulfuracidifex metallicus]MCY0849595.1 DNA-binding protein [Sulfuracidifex metallicus]
MDKKPNEVLVSMKNVEDYVLEIITMLNQGAEEVEIKGVGRDIGKAVDVYNMILDKLGNGIKLDSVSIGSENRDKKRLSFILLRVKKVY